MALWAVVFLGSTPIGGPLTGLIVRGFGVRTAIAFGGVAALATAAGDAFCEAVPVSADGAPSAARAAAS